MTPIVIGEASALLLGPLIVEPVFRSQGIGEALVNRSLEAAKAAGWKLVLLVGDEPLLRADGVSARAQGQNIDAWPSGPRPAPLLRARAGRSGDNQGGCTRRLSPSKRPGRREGPGRG